MPIRIGVRYSRHSLIFQNLSSRHCLSTLVKNLRPSVTSTVERGNAFEERSLKLLGQTMSMSLKRVGGKEDGGIDLLGWWWLPHALSDSPGNHPSSSLEKRRRIRVAGQCKAEKKKMGPSYVRELEGVVFRFLATSPGLGTIPSPQALTPPVVALLISQSAFTKSTLIRAQSSPIPFCLLHLPPIQELSTAPHADTPLAELVPATGDVGSALCNPALSGLQGLLKGQLEIRWERHPMGYSGRPALWWNAVRLPSHISSVE